MWIRGSTFRAVLDAVITDLEEMSADGGPCSAEWLTITAFAERSRVPRPTLIGRLDAWFNHHTRKGRTPWTCPVTCPIYRYGRWPREPRKGRKPGCWLLDASRESAIRRELRNFGRPSTAERIRARECR